MSELKAYRVKGVTLGDTYDVYIKEEADKVIAHSKYKRCFAMAKWCYDRWIRAYNSSRLQKAGFYAQWQKRWMELA